MKQSETDVITSSISGAVLHNLLKKIIDKVGYEHTEELSDEQIVEVLLTKARSHCK